ncbi:uncharacterized protein EV422DRAFT_547661 [Fimicolochytrium jonesii]|uniref:uncharacterized protein n=1 Tax=Fimicolochytrium jonesii TaxID=1396493 RepID=UPI0022FE8080|nr:uncharacterized protein EV422DRAFT_547661 [Fimicolochytrium jonesii]KAI8815933.1 hypothetical protein EV422DRAFT_547661 [Fimicolochytrium jonesii]
MEQPHHPQPLELRHLTAAKLLDPDDLRIGTDFRLDGQVGDLAEESIPNYDESWDTDSVEMGHMGGGGGKRSARTSPLRGTAVVASDLGLRRTPNGTAGEENPNGSGPTISERTSSTVTAAPAAELAVPKTREDSLTQFPEMGRPSLYLPPGPVAYKQLSFDDDHDDHDLVVMGESDIDIHSPNGEEIHSWAHQNGRGGETWFSKQWRGMLQMICAAPCNQ